MVFLDNYTYFKIKKNGISQFQSMSAYLAGSAFQTIGDNPVTAYRQLVQQYAKDTKGQMVDPKIAVRETNAVFLKSPVAKLFSCWSYEVPRLGGTQEINYMNLFFDCCLCY